MSFDIELVDAEGCVLDSCLCIEEGGTYIVGGTTKCELNVTYNYGAHLRDHLDLVDGIRWLYRKTGAETADRLDRAVRSLGVERDADYWAQTPGNAGYALSILAGWAHEFPDGIWGGD